MTGQPVTDNPLLIMLINMTIVFAVLYLLGYVIHFIHWIDPTVSKGQPKIIHDYEEEEPEELEQESAAEQLERRTLIAVITAAIMAYGYKDVKIKSFRKIDE